MVNLFIKIVTDKHNAYNKACFQEKSSSDNTRYRVLENQGGVHQIAKVANNIFNVVKFIVIH